MRGAAREVLCGMGLEAAALDRNTGERGTEWVGEVDRVIARFVVEDEGAEGYTAEMEILRGDSVAATEQGTLGATVIFVSGRRERYDIVVVAEGVGSSTRETLFSGENWPRWMDVTIAFLTIPLQPDDRPFARLYSTVGGRGATIRPGPEGKLHVYLGVQKRPEDEHEWGANCQKQFLKDHFADAGWHFPCILQGMSQTKDFYFDVLRQVSAY